MTAAVSRPRLFAALRVEVSFFFFAAFRFSGLCKRLSVHDQVPRYREITQTCSLQTAFWLRKCQSILTHIQHSSEPDMVCHRVSPFSTTACLSVGPMSFEWRFSLSTYCCKKMQTVIVLKTLVFVPQHCVGDAMLFNPGVVWDHLARNTCAHIPAGGLRCISWNTSSSQRPREQKHICLTRLANNFDIICLHETYGKDELLHGVQVLSPQFRLFATFTPNNVNVGGSTIVIRKNLHHLPRA